MVTATRRPSNHYDYIDPWEAFKIVMNCEWIRKGLDDVDNINDDGESQMINAYVSGVQHYGATDYKDHRQDSDEDLKKLVWDSITARNGYTHQRIHYYNREGKPYTKILFWGSCGGYSARFIQ